MQPYRPSCGLRAGRSTTEQIYNLRSLCDKYFKHQQILYNVIIDLKKEEKKQLVTWYGVQPYRPSCRHVQYFCKSSSQLGTALGQGYKCSLDESGHGRMALNSWSKDKGVFCHPPSSIFSSNGSCLGALEEQYGIANIDGRAVYQSAICRWRRCSS